MLTVNHLIGFGVGSTSAPASFVFNGTDETIQHTLAAAASSTTLATLSFWTRLNSVSVFHAWFRSATGANTNDSSIWFNGTDDSINLSLFNGEELAASAITASNVWRHVVCRYDSTQGTADNRIRIYVDNVLLTDSGTTPSLNAAIHFFDNANIVRIGTDRFDDFLAGKMAFIDCLDGQSLAPTSFAFDNSGTWTRQPYTGAYGNNGFSLGTNGFTDAGPNGKVWTLNNMDTSNLDFADLPPYTL